jgi:hypothetical protein
MGQTKSLQNDVQMTGAPEVEQVNPITAIPTAFNASAIRTSCSPLSNHTIAIIFRRAIVKVFKIRIHPSLHIIQVS